MPLRASFRLSLRRAAGTAALGALFAPTLAAPAPAQAARPKAPVITSVAPLNLAVGQTLTLRGRNFVKGKGKNTVVFKRAGGRAVFVKADIATAKLLRVELPAKLESALRARGDARVGTRFEIRVLGRKLSKATSPKLSPVIEPAPEEAPPAGPVATPAPTLTPLAPAAAPLATPVETLAQAESPAPASAEPEPCRRDDDLLEESLETRLGLDPCKADTDGDGVDDGFEYRSAVDLNDDDYEHANNSRPAPEQRPYPNPLFDDSEVDFDGDSLKLSEEFALWRFTVAQGASRRLDALTYSDGEQYSLSTRVNGQRTPSQTAVGYPRQSEFLAWADSQAERIVGLQGVNDLDFRDLTAPAHDAPRTFYDIRDFDRSSGSADPTLVGAPTAAEQLYYDHDGDTRLSDEERDEDADGLTNFWEARNCMVRSYWNGVYEDETPYYRAFEGTDPVDADSDGDGLRDGADDQDNDDVPNMMECSRDDAGGTPNAPTDPDPRDDGQPTRSFVNPFNPCLPAIKSRSCARHVPLADAWAPFNPDERYFYVWN